MFTVCSPPASKRGSAPGPSRLAFAPLHLCIWVSVSLRRTEQSRTGQGEDPFGGVLKNLTLQQAGAGHQYASCCLGFPPPLPQQPGMVWVERHAASTYVPLDFQRLTRVAGGPGCLLERLTGAGASRCGPVSWKNDGRAFWARVLVAPS